MATPKTILITGCSSGIGQALALEFKKLGHSVFATARQPAALQAFTALGLNQACIANLGSISGLVTTACAGVCCASKAALHALSDAMRMELGPLGVRVVTVQPGGIRSKFGDNAEHLIQFPEGSLYTPIAKFVRGRAQLSQRGATPSEVFAATVVAHLLNPKAGPICRTGSLSTRLPLLKRVLPTKSLDARMQKLFGLDRL